MKPNTKSIYFKLSIVFLLAFFIHLFILAGFIRHYVASSSSSTNHYSGFLIFVPVTWVSLSGLSFYKSTNSKQTPIRQLVAFLLSPVVLAPILGIIYTIVVLLPLYSLVNKGGF